MTTTSADSTLDPRFSFSVYLPEGRSSKSPLLVFVHGIGREIDGYLRGMRGFCERHGCVLMCPLFPEGIPDPKQKNSYRNLSSKGIRFDKILLSMIEQAGQSWGIQTDRFYLQGFSGGGQFVHRFTYLYPDRISAVSIGAPGRLTVPDRQSRWPEGVADVSEVFGLPSVDFEKMARVQVQFVVGEKDVGTSKLEDMKNPTKFETEAGKTRLERSKWLKGAWEDVGIVSELTVVPGIGHDGLKCLSAVEEWLDRVIGS